MTEQDTAGPIIFLIFGCIMIFASALWFIGTYIGIDLGNIISEGASAFGDFMSNWGTNFGEFMSNWGENFGALLRGTITQDSVRVFGIVALLFAGLAIIVVSLKALRK